MYWLTECVPSWPSAVKALRVSLNERLPLELVRWWWWCGPGEEREGAGEGLSPGDGRCSSGAIGTIASGEAERCTGDGVRAMAVGEAENGREEDEGPSIGVGGSSENECEPASCSRTNDGSRGWGERIAGEGARDGEGGCCGS